MSQAGGLSGNIATTGNTLIQTQVASSSANIVFTSTYLTSTYNNFLLVFSNVIPATVGALLELVVSTNNGSTYVSTGYQSARNSFYSNATGVGSFSTTGTFFFLSGPQGTFAWDSFALGSSGSINLYSFTNGAAPVINGLTTYNDSVSEVSAVALIMGTVATTSINNIKIQCSTGNIASGIFSLYGISN